MFLPHFSLRDALILSCLFLGHSLVLTIPENKFKTIDLSKIYVSKRQLLHATNYALVKEQGK